MYKKKISSLKKTWLFDIDGTIVKHNGYKLDGEDTLLPGVADFLKKMSEDDVVIFLTSRTEEYKKITEDFLKKNGIHYDYIIYGLPYGERVLINDRKTSGLETAISINTNRDEFMQVEFEIDYEL